MARVWEDILLAIARCAVSSESSLQQASGRLAVWLVRQYRALQGPTTFSGGHAPQTVEPPGRAVANAGRRARAAVAALEPAASRQG